MTVSRKSDAEPVWSESSPLQRYTLLRTERLRAALACSTCRKLRSILCVDRRTAASSTRAFSQSFLSWRISVYRVKFLEKSAPFRADMRCDNSPRADVTTRWYFALASSGLTLRSSLKVWGFSLSNTFWQKSSMWPWYAFHKACRFSVVANTCFSASFADFATALSLSNWPANHAPITLGICFATLFPDFAAKYPCSVCASCLTRRALSIEVRGYMFDHTSSTPSSISMLSIMSMLCISSSALAFVVASFFDRFLNVTIKLGSDIEERSGSSFR